MQKLTAKERFFWMAFSVVLLLVALVTANKSRKEAASTSRRLKIMFKRETAMRNEINFLNWRIEQIKSAPLSNDDLQELTKKGLKHPPKDLFFDLTKHEDSLIPNKGVMGNRSGYYLPDKSRILNARWYLGVFQYGTHIHGASLLQYKVAKNGKISWKLLDARWEDARYGGSGEMSGGGNQQ